MVVRGGSAMCVPYAGRAMKARAIHVSNSSNGSNSLTRSAGASPRCWTCTSQRGRTLATFLSRAHHHQIIFALQKCFTINTSSQQGEDSVAAEFDQPKVNFTSVMALCNKESAREAQERIGREAETFKNCLEAVCSPPHSLFD